MNTGPHPTDRYEDRLLSALKQVVVERSAMDSAPPVRRVTTPPWRSGWKRQLGLAAAGLGLAAAVIVPLAPGKGVAYAVTPQGDGRVRVEINHLSDADGLERKLEEVGIAAEVDYLPTGTRCNEPRFTAVPGDAREMIGFEGASDGSLAFTIDPADFGEGRTLVIVTSGPQEGPPTDGTEVLAIVAEGRVGTCEPVKDPEGNLPGFPRESPGGTHS